LIPSPFPRDYPHRRPCAECRILRAFLLKWLRAGHQTNSITTRCPTKATARYKLDSVMSRSGSRKRSTCARLVFRNRACKPPEIKALPVANVLLQNLPPGATNEPMDKAISRYTSLDQMKSDEYRNWQELPAHERMSAVAELTLAAYRMREPALDVRRLQRTLVHLQRPES
jgi:hypothetical protein